MAIARHRHRLLVLATLLVVVGSATLVPVVPPAYAAPSAEQEPNNSLETANPIQIGALDYLDATIGAAADQDFFAFTPAANQSYAVETFNVAGAYLQVCDGGAGLRP